MTIHAYSQLYLSKVSRTIGNMLHYAVYVFGFNGAVFLNQFIQAGVAKQIEDGNPKYIAGKSGFELCLDVIEITTKENSDLAPSPNYERSAEYWVGWMLAHYQWYSGKSFKSILDAVSFEECLNLYNPLHEADIHKCYEVMDLHCAKTQSKLKSVRRKCKLTQESLAKNSEVSLNTIRSYERKSKDINKAQLDIILRLSKTLKCEITDLIE